MLDTIADRRAALAREPGRSRRADDHPPRFPHAEGFGTDGWADGARRNRLGRRAHPQSAARRGSPGDARGARDDRRRWRIVPALGRRIDDPQTRHPGSRGAAGRDSRRRGRVAVDGAAAVTAGRRRSRGPPDDPTPPSRSADVIELRELGDVGSAPSAHISSIVDLADVAFDCDAEIIDFASIRATADVGSPMARAEVPPAPPEISPPRPAAADAVTGTSATPAIIDAATFIDLAPVDLTASENIDISGVIDIEPVEAPFDRFVPEVPMLDFDTPRGRPGTGRPRRRRPGPRGIAGGVRMGRR